ncbi:MAG: hypothetical protein O2820_09530 [Planctomycetota bacterium]|nr:hypothetical protein [Planctomycetota bacterium]MDA1249454.1 hypothetical protein [Planctomycetota bacterium]
MLKPVAVQMSFRKRRLPFDGLLCAVFGVALLFASLSDVSLAQDGRPERPASTTARAPSAASQARPRFERVFVPARQPGSWPDGKWIPIEAERVLPFLNDDPVRKPVSQTWFSSAVYSATFDPVSQTLIAGAATLEIASSTDNSTSRLEPIPDFIPLDPLNLSIQSAVWSDDGKRAILGADSEGEQKLFSRGRHGSLKLQWKKASRRTPFGLEFDIALPRAIVSKLQLMLPDGWVATTVGSGFPLTAGNAAQPWTFPLGIRNQVRVRVSPVAASSAPTSAPPVAWQQNTRFAVRLDSLQGFAEFNLDGSNLSVASLPTLLVPEEYQIDSLRDAANVPILWKREEPVAGGLQRIQLAPGSEAVAIIDRFTMTFSPSTPSRQSRLVLKAPRLSSGILLDGSRVNVTVAAPLTVGSYMPSGMRLLETSPPDHDAGGGEFRLTFQQFQSESTLDLQLSRPGQTEPSIDVRELALLQLDQTPPTVIADIQLTAGTRDIFDFRTLLPRNWEVNSVQLVTPGRTAQPDSIADDRQITWQLQDSSDSHRRLTVDFADSLPLKRPVILRIHADLPDTANALQITPVAVPDLPMRVELTIAVIDRAPARSTLNSSLFQQLPRSAAAARADWSTLISATDEDTRFWSARLWNGPEDAMSTKLLIPERTSAGNPESTEEAATKPAETAELTPRSLTSPSSEPRSPGLRPVATALLKSRISLGAGRDEHALTWQFLYPISAGVFQFTLPDSATLLFVEWDGERTPVNESGQDCSIPVPQSATGQRLTVHYTLPSIDVFLRETYRAAVPRADVAIAGFRWSTTVSDDIAIVSFSDDFSVSVDSARHDGSATSSANLSNPGWLVWFFGPLTRSSKQTAFNPVSADSWVSWATAPPPTADETAGWRTVTAESGSMPDSFAVHICHIGRRHHLAWFILIVSGLVGAILRATQVTARSRIGILWVTGCIASAALVPATYAELIGAGVLGSILAALIPRRLIRPPRVEEPVTRTVQRSMPSTVSVRNIPTALIFVAVGSGLAACLAQDETRNVEPTIQVLIPYEDAKNPTATIPTLVYVDRSSLPRLESLSPLRKAQPDSLVTRADYRGTVDSIGRIQLTADLIIAIRGTPAEVLLGIPARFLTGRSESELDGRPVKLLPDVSGQRLILTLPSSTAEPETPLPATTETDPKQSSPEASNLPVPASGFDEWSLHTLSFQLRPEVVSKGNTVANAIPVPRVADGRLVLSFIDVPASLRVSDSTIPLAALSNRLERNLEPAADLQIEWSSTEESPVVDQPGIECRSSAVVHSEWIDRHLTVKYPAGSTSRFLAWRLPGDSLVREESIKAPGLSSVQIRSTTDGRVVLLEIEPPSDRFLIEIPWRQPRSRPLKAGFDVEVPVDPFRNQLVLATQEHLAGFSPALGFPLIPQVQTPLSETDTARETASETWQSLWLEGERSRPANLIVGLKQLAKLSLDVAPQSPRRTARPTQLLKIARDQVEMRFSAEIAVAQAAAFVHELRIPAQLAIDSVTVFEDDVDRLSHWDRRGSTLLLHLGNGTTGRQNVVLEGRLPVAADGRLPVAEVTVENAISAEPVVRILRPTDLNVVAGKGLELVAATSPDEPRESALPNGDTAVDSISQLSARYRFTSTNKTAPRSGLVVISSAAPRDRVHAMTVLRSTTPESINVELLVLAQSLQKPQLVLQFPDWPFVSNSIAHAECADLLSQKFDPELQVLTLTFADPVPRNLSVLILATLTRDRVSESSEDTPQQFQLRPPSIAASHVELFLVLASDLKTELAAAIQNQPEANRDSPGQFLNEFQEPAFMRPLLERRLIEDAVIWQSPLTIARVRPALTLPSSKALVMHAFMPGRKKSAIGLTRILLVPNQQNPVAIDWPADVRLIAVYVNDRPQRASAPENGRLNVALPDEAGPQLIELLWQQVRTSSGLKIRRTESVLPAPRIPSVEPVPILIIPSRGTSVMSVGTGDDQEASHLLLNSLEEWDARLPQSRGCEILTTRILEALAPLEESEADDATATDRLGQEERARSLLAVRLRFETSPSLSHQSGVASGLESVFQDRERSTTLVAVRQSSPVSLWVIDDRLDGIMTGVFVALLAFPVVWLLLRLETGDRLAVNPTMSWLMLGLIWWLCLRASPAGLLVAGVSSVCLTVRFLKSHRHGKSAA